MSDLADELREELTEAEHDQLAASSQWERENAVARVRRITAVLNEIELATCGCGDTFTLDNRGTCVNCIAGMAKPGEDIQHDAARWDYFASSPQTALMLGSLHDPNDSAFPWRAESDKLADRAMERNRKE